MSESLDSFLHSCSAMKTLGRKKMGRERELFRESMEEEEAVEAMRGGSKMK